jgi:hypothetical protein
VPTEAVKGDIDAVHPIERSSIGDGFPEEMKTPVSERDAVFLLEEGSRPFQPLSTEGTRSGDL